MDWDPQNNFDFEAQDPLDDFGYEVQGSGIETSALECSTCMGSGYVSGEQVNLYSPPQHPGNRTSVRCPTCNGKGRGHG